METFEQVITARNTAAQGSINSQDEAQLRVALDRLLALGEAYPDLKASANFQELQRELADVEDKLAAARRSRVGASLRQSRARKSSCAPPTWANSPKAPRQRPRRKQPAC